MPSAGIGRGGTGLHGYSILKGRTSFFRIANNLSIAMICSELNLLLRMTSVSSRFDRGMQHPLSGRWLAQDDGMP